MENERNQYLALRGICLRAGLVLVSAVPDLDSEWHNDSVFAAGVDAVAGSHWRTQHLFRNGCGMAAFRNVAAGVSSRGMGRKAAFWECILRRRHGRFRANRPDREIRVPNLWLRTALPGNGTTGRDARRVLS